MNKKLNPAPLSIVLPVFNESKAGFLPKVVEVLEKFRLKNPSVEILVVDGGSSDDTLRLVEDSGFHVMVTSQNSRAARINCGIEASTGDLVLIHHPRVYLSAEGLSALIEQGHRHVWGCFTHGFEKTPNMMLKFTSWYSNRVRADLRGIVYLDHCIFFNRKILHERFKQETLLFPERDIFEDTDFSLRLRQYGLPTRLNFPSTCSAIRFEKNGLLRQLTLNQVMKICYHLKVSDQLMNQIYEKGLSLNSVYEKHQSNQH